LTGIYGYIPTPPHDSWHSHEAEKENGRWTKRPKRTLGKGCKRRTMHHVTIKQKNQKKGRQKEGNLPPRKLSPKKCLQKNKKQKKSPQVSPKEQEATISPPPLRPIHSK